MWKDLQQLFSPRFSPLYGIEAFFYSILVPKKRYNNLFAAPNESPVGQTNQEFRFILWLAFEQD
jgi:hypothetical protein